MTKTAVVILNWNGRAMLERYLSSVLAHSGDAEIIVADNGSTDDSLEFLTNYSPKVRTICLSQNYGFAEGYNRALKEVAAEYYMLLNSDVEVTPGWLDTLVKYMDDHQEVAACQPKLLSLTDRERFEYAGAAGGFIDHYGYPFCRGRLFDTLEVDKGQYDDIAPVLWASGACLLIRSEDFWRVGGFDGRFFAHCEEIDLC
jgi:GT2 family glycosyltransferase